MDWSEIIPIFSYRSLPYPISPRKSVCFICGPGFGCAFIFSSTVLLNQLPDLNGHSSSSIGKHLHFLTFGFRQTWYGFSCPGQSLLA